MHTDRSVKTWRQTALSQPWTTVGYLLRRTHYAQDAMVMAAARHLFGRDVRLDIWKAKLAELDSFDLVPPTDTAPVGNSHLVTLGRWLYSLIRVSKPRVVIETGVAHGMSAWLILNALEKNGRGILHSIDLPDHDTNPAFNVSGQSETGHLVPAVLRDRWNLVLGDSTIALPRLLRDLGSVDVFLHDSDHSYRAMRQEFEAVVPHIAIGGVLVSDDVQKNRAFNDACQDHRLRAYVFRKGGAARVAPLDQQSRRRDG